MPAACLANDLMIFYAPEEIYTQGVTVLEMICASTCITSMICFTLDAKYRSENPMDAAAHMPRHRMGARGNATTFPLPWQDLLQQLEDMEELEKLQESKLQKAGKEHDAQAAQHAEKFHGDKKQKG